MSKGKKDKSSTHYRAHGFFDKLDIRGFKREAVVRGMPFQEVLDADIPQMYNYIVNHFNDEKDPELLDKYDDFVEEKLKEAEVDGTLLHASLRLGFIGERDDDGMITRIKRVAGMSKKKRKPRAQKNKFGVVGGTAKALTFELFYQGKEKAEILAEVLEKFPNTSDKSIGIWFNKAKRKSKENREKIQEERRNK